MKDMLRKIRDIKSRCAEQYDESELLSIYANNLAKGGSDQALNKPNTPASANFGRRRS